MANEVQAPVKKVSPVLDIVTLAKRNFAARLPKGVDHDRFFLGIISAIQKSKATASEGKSLADCDPNSVLLAAYDAADVGCSLSPSLALGWLIPYGKEAQFQPSYRFFIQKAYDTKEVKTFFAEVVYKGDKFERQFAPNRSILHEPGPRESVKMSDALGAYAYIKFTDDTVDWEYLTAEQIDRHRKHSKQPNSMKWLDFWEEGWRITPIRVLAKRLPLKNRDLEGLVEIVNHDAERDLDLPADQIVIESAPSVPRRISEASKPAPSEAGKSDQTEKPKEEKPKEEQPTAQSTSQATAQASNATAAPASMFEEGEPDPYVTPAEISDFWEKAFKAEWTKNDAIKFIQNTYKVSSLKDLRRSQLVSALDTIQQARK